MVPLLTIMAAYLLPKRGMYVIHDYTYTDYIYAYTCVCTCRAVSEDTCSYAKTWWPLWLYVSTYVYIVMLLLRVKSRY